MLLKKLLANIFESFGFQIKRITKRTSSSPEFFSDMNHNLGFELEKEANDKIGIVRRNTMLPYLNLVTLYEQVVYCEKNNIVGDFVECGVWKGGSIGLMALANLKHGKNRRQLHLFDSFEGICLPENEHDGNKALTEVKPYLDKSENIDGSLKPIEGLYDQFGGIGTLEENSNLLEERIKYPQKYIYYHKGWFQDTIPIAKNEINSIAILRLDGDWYSSTKICLDHLYDKVVLGGFIIIDDYGCYEGCKKAVDEFIEKRNLNIYLNYSDKNCRYWIKN